MSKPAKKPAEPADVPIDSALMVHVMTMSGRQWQARYGTPFALFMNRAVAEPPPTRPQMREGPRRSGEAA